MSKQNHQKTVVLCQTAAHINNNINVKDGHNKILDGA